MQKKLRGLQRDLGDNGRNDWGRLSYCPQQASSDYFLRWRILARMRLFLRPTLRRPLPVFFTPTYKLLLNRL